MHNVYWECEKMNRKYTKRFIYFVIFHTSLLNMILVYALICIAFGYYDTSNWHLPFYMEFPFDQTSILGWFVTWIVQFCSTLFYAWSMTAITSYFVSCCNYIIAMVEHFGLLINSLTINVKRKQMEEKPQKVAKIRLQITDQLCSIVKMHIKIYE